MSKLKIALAAAVAASSVYSTLPASAGHSKAHAALAALDPDNDGSLDRGEVVRGAIAKFNSINPDRDGTVDAGELHGVLTARGLASADPDNDGSLTLGEYIRFTLNVFKHANTDGDRTIEVDEMHSYMGRLLVRLIH